MMKTTKKELEMMELSDDVLDMVVGGTGSDQEEIVGNKVEELEFEVVPTINLIIWHILKDVVFCF